MNSRALAFAAIIAGVAALPSTATHAASSVCALAATAVEEHLGLPSGLLRSIGEVETGNRPLSVDTDGVGANFASADEAIAFVRNGARAARFVDVGCFQIDLAYHPEAFRTLADAFDPLANAIAAGRYLLALRRDAPSWSDAVARYHSGLRERGDAYASRVYASLGAGISAEPGEGSTLSDGVRVIVPRASGAFGDRSRIGGEFGLPVVQTP